MHCTTKSQSAKALIKKQKEIHPSVFLSIRSNQSYPARTVSPRQESSRNPLPVLRFCRHFSDLSPRPSRYLHTPRHDIEPLETENRCFHTRLPPCMYIRFSFFFSASCTFSSRIVFTSDTCLLAISSLLYTFFRKLAILENLILRPAFIHTLSKEL